MATSSLGQACEPSGSMLKIIVDVSISFLFIDSADSRCPVTPAKRSSRRQFVRVLRNESSQSRKTLFSSQDRENRAYLYQRENFLFEVSSWNASQGLPTLSSDPNAAPGHDAACKSSFHPDRPPYHRFVKKCQAADRSVQSNKFILRYPGRIYAGSGEQDMGIDRQL